MTSVSAGDVFELYTAATGNGRRATIILEESGLPFTLRKMDLASGELKQPEFLRINPQGTIPVLIHRRGGRERVVNQSGAIVLYIAEINGRFLPLDIEDRYRALTRFFTAQTDMAAASTAIYHQEFVLPARSEDNLAFYRDRFLRLMDLAEGWLGEGEYIAGPEVTVADFALVPIVIQRSAMLDGPRFTELTRWAARMMERPAVARALAR